VICSNWDWDLAEAVEEAGLTTRFDALLSSAWVGARKPHPRIYARALLEAGVEADEALFVGDTWGPDVEGPLAAGIPAVYLRRVGHWPDGTCPHDDPTTAAVPVLPDLTGLLDLVDGAAVPSVHDEPA
jgi:putative hydrolase of the HAD superfamily